MPYTVLYFHWLDVHIVLYFHWVDVHIVPAVALTPFEALCLFTTVFKQQQNTKFTFPQVQIVHLDWRV